MAGTPNVPGNRLLTWLGDHLFAAVLAFFVALGLGVWFGTGGTTDRAKQPVRSSHLSRVRSDSWPDGVSAWTVVLASAPTQGQAEAALDLARRIPSRGMNLGVVRSNDYTNLTRGYWVAFVGQFESEEEAQRVAGRYQRVFSTHPYQRFIEEKQRRP
jgi:SPOR domain